MRATSRVARHASGHTRNGQAVGELFSVPVSADVVTGMIKRVAGSLGGCLEAIRQALITADVVHFDETGFRVAGKEFRTTAAA